MRSNPKNSDPIYVLKLRVRRAFILAGQIEVAVGTYLLYCL